MACDFCRMEENGDVPNEREYLFDEIWDREEIRAFDNGDLKAELKLGVEVRAMLQVYRDELSLSLDDNDPELWTDEGHNILWDKKINFCPICGEKLRPRIEVDIEEVT